MLVPLFFLVFINDLPAGVIGQNITDIFADDNSMSSSALISNIDALRSNLNHQPTQLDSWSANNRFRLNTSKRKSMLIASKNLRNKFIEGDNLLNIKLKNSILEQVFTYKQRWYHNWSGADIWWSSWQLVWQIGATHRITEVNTLPSSLIWKSSILQHYHQTYSYVW